MTSKAQTAREALQLALQHINEMEQENLNARDTHDAAIIDIKMTLEKERQEVVRLRVALMSARQQMAHLEFELRNAESDNQSSVITVTRRY